MSQPQQVNSNNNSDKFMKSLQDKLKEYKINNFMENEIIEFKYDRLNDLGGLIKMYYKDEDIIQNKFDKLVPNQKKLFESFLKRKNYILNSNSKNLSYKQIREYQSNYKSRFNDDDKERLIFKSFDYWIKKICSSKTTNSSKVKNSIKRNKNNKNKRIYLKIFKEEWVNHPINKWKDSQNQSDSQDYSVPVDINKVKEKNEDLKKFGELFFDCPKARKKMKIFLNNENNLFINLIKNSIDVKIGKKINKFHSILSQVKTKDQDEAMGWFSNDVSNNKRSKLPVLFLDAKEAEAYFKRIYKYFLND